MKERGILFSGPMVRAILEGRKTQTRRPIKPQPDSNGPKGWDDVDWVFRAACPYGQEGDRLWVRETYHQPRCFQCDEGYEDDPCICFDPPHYRASYPTDLKPTFNWTPSIHMPRWASRIDLEITKVRVERVQDITPAEILKEGAPADIKCGDTFEWFKELWDSIYSKRGLGWNENPLVFMREFKRRD